MANEDNSMQFLKRRGLINFSVQHVIAEYLDCKDTLESFANRWQNDPDRRKRMVQAGLKLQEIREALMPEQWWKCRKIFLAWRLIHRVAEDLILLMNCEELAAQGRKIIHNLKTSPLPDIVRLDWISSVEEKLKKLEDSIQNGSCEIEKGTPQLFRTVTNIINDNVDDRFWDIWCRRLLIFIYTGLLVIGLLSQFAQFYRSGVFSLGIDDVILLGAMGGVASGILTSEQEYMAKGHFWISVISYPLTRLTQGALVALVVFWMIQCNYFIRIEPPLERYNKAFFCMTSPVWHDPAFRRNSVRRKPVPVTFHSYSSEKKEPILDLKAPPGKQIYLYLLVLFFAGFTGDKLLKFISDKVTSRLFSEAEKSKQAKS